MGYLYKNKPEQAFRAFLYDPEFLLADIKIMIFDTEGVVYVPSTARTHIWDNIKNYKNKHGKKPLELFINKAAQGGGWVDCEWKGGYRVNYVEKLEKNGVIYLVTAGYYPISKKRAVENLVP